MRVVKVRGVCENAGTPARLTFASTWSRPYLYAARCTVCGETWRAANPEEYGEVLSE